MLVSSLLFLAIDHYGLIQQEPSSEVHPRPIHGDVLLNRPVTMCGSSGGVNKGDRGSGNCPFDFILSLSQKSLVQVQGSNNSVQLFVTLVSGVSPPVIVSAKGVPVGMKILFAPESARPSFSSTLTIASSLVTPPSQFNITILAAGRGVERSAFLSLLVLPIVHDLAVVSAQVQGTATVGSIVVINATAANYGSLLEAFELRAYANTTLIADLSVPRLPPASIYASRLTWNTTGFSPGTYTVLVTIPPIQGELNFLDNSREAGKIVLTQTPGSTPSPSPAASGAGQGFNYGRQLAIVVAIAEAAVVFLVVLRKSKGSRGDTSAGTRKV